MTKISVYNEPMLDVAFAQIYSDFKEKKELNISWEKIHKDKTMAQNNFFWGAIVETIINFFEENGIKYTKEEVKDNFYQAIAPRKTITQFNGKKYETWKHISEMSLEEMSEFIDKSIWLCDKAKAFQGMILHPSIRYTWIRHITQEELLLMDKRFFPRKCPEYLSYIRKQACLCCGRFNSVEAHHLKEAGESGTAYKVDDWETIPLCQECHRAYHTKGKEWFNNQINWLIKYINLDDFTACCYNKWLMKK